LLTNVEKRPFVLSTPRLPDDNHLHLALPFKSDKLDKLFAARTVPITEQQIDEIFDGVAMEGGLDHKALFTTDEPYAVHEPVVEDVRFEYTGHAGLTIQSSEVCVLIDPVIASRKPEYANDLISFSQLPDKIDYICLTHNHSDHVNIETLLQLRHKTSQIIVPKNNGGSLADPSLKLLLRQIGFNVMEVEDLEAISIPQGRILPIPFLGEHGDLNIRSKSAWLVELKQQKIYAGADSSNLEPKMYQHLQRLVGDLDILAIGMECVGAPYTWLYGALTTSPVSREIKHSRRLNGSGCEAASKMVDTFSPKQVLIYALGLEPWYGYFMGIDYSDDSAQIVESGKFKDYCESMGIAVQRLQGKYTTALPLADKKKYLTI
jgi:L-ascorbate metabolism protein UlaG (beta-lactamase superfamily)